MLEDEVKADVKDEEECGEAPASLPSDEELKSLLYGILESANLEELTKRAARRLLENKLGRCLRQDESDSPSWWRSFPTTDIEPRLLRYTYA
jgi:hypothetical protein